jgi:hypothetical protein
LLVGGAHAVGGAQRRGAARRHPLRDAVTTWLVVFTAVVLVGRGVQRAWDLHVSRIDDTAVKSSQQRNLYVFPDH